MTANNKLYAGSSGLVLPVPQSKYPQEFQGKSRLQYYSSLFNTVEINSSFYKNPQRSTVSKWAESVPDRFRFTFKLSKAVTHAKGLGFNDADIDEFMKVINYVEDKKGCLLVQLPPKLTIESIIQLERLLETLHDVNPDNGWKIAVEFRNNAWYHEETYHLLSHNNAAMVIQDLPASATPVITSSKAGFMYLRFHGTEPRYRGSYTGEVLKGYANLVKEGLKRGDVYAYFNNTMGNAYENLQTLTSLVRSRY